MKGKVALGRTNDQRQKNSIRQNTVELIKEAVKNGAKLKNACPFFRISTRTYQRWVDLYEKTGSYSDLRPTAERNHATSVDRKAVLDILHSGEFADLPPCEIILILADREQYIASESTFYRILREEKENNHRGRGKEPVRKPPSPGYPLFCFAKFTLYPRAPSLAFGNSPCLVSNDNAYAESIFKTLKYRPNYQPDGFESIDEGRAWVLGFEQWYNYEHHHSGIKYLTQHQRYSGEGEAILAKRKAVYEAPRRSFRSDGKAEPRGIGRLRRWFI